MMLKRKSSLWRTEGCEKLPPYRLESMNWPLFSVLEQQKLNKRSYVILVQRDTKRQPVQFPAPRTERVVIMQVTITFSASGDDGFVFTDKLFVL